jgi:hypothetical protein
MDIWPLLLRDHSLAIDELVSFGSRGLHLTYGGGPGTSLWLLRHLMLTGWLTDAGSLLPHHWPSMRLLAEAGGQQILSGATPSPFDDLSAISSPIPYTAISPFDYLKPQATLRNVLVSVLAQPAAATLMLPEESFELLLFAACYLMTPHRIGRQPSVLAELVLDEKNTGAAAFASEQASELAAAALRWLDQGLPRWVFHSDIEEMISSVNVTVPPFVPATAP